ncbi:hypothetical protein PT300_00120 [Enterobacteriaceae bacterium ESL0689]|nr:hypothetical protein [Enterobacteriaceae bacterium ESL0689]
MANQFLTMADGAKEQVSRVLAPWYPEAAGLANDTSATLDRVGKAYEDLLTLQKAARQSPFRQGSASTTT